MSAGTYPFASTRSLRGPRPYSFAPFTGEAGLRAWVEERRRMDRMLRLRAAPVCEEEGGSPSRWETTVERVLATGRFQDVPPRRSLELARTRWRRGLERHGAVETTEVLATIVAPCLDHGAPLLGPGEAVAWARETVDRLAGRVAAFGKVFESYDARWRRAEGAPATCAPLPWLALGAAWLSLGWAWADRSGPSLGALDALLKTHDRLGAELAERGWEATAFEARLVLISRRLEENLVQSLWDRCALEVAP